MKAVTFETFNIDALSVKTIPIPDKPIKHDLKIKIYAASLNPIDKIRVEGGLKMFVSEPEPHLRVIGYDIAGEVIEIGEEVTKFKFGDRICCRLVKMQYGALAEYCVTSEYLCALLPDSISYIDGAAIGLAGMTALQMLKRANCNSNSKVFITGGAGGVGTILIGLAKNTFGAKKVVATASAGIGTDICLKCGADKVVDYKKNKFWEVEERDYDILLDTTGESVQLANLALPKAKIITINGAPTASEAIEKFHLGFGYKLLLTPLFGLMNFRKQHAASSVGATWEYLFLNPNGDDLAELVKAVEKGEVKVIIDTVAKGIDNFKEATDKLFGKHAKGKCIVQIVE